MAPIKIYNTELSPPGRAVWMAASALGLEWTHEEVDIFNKEQYAPQFVKLNPQHTIPLLNDNGVIMWDSHVIMSYLVEKYGKNDTLYPKDLVKRALVDQRMHFDGSVAFPLIRRIFAPMIYYNEKSVTPRLLEELDIMYGFVNAFLEGNTWICGENLTIGDFGLLATMSSLTAVFPVDSKKHPNIMTWIKRAETTLPYFNKVNAQGNKVFQEKMTTMIKKFE